MVFSKQWKIGAALVALCLTGTPAHAATAGTFTLAGLTTPATVAETIFVYATGLPVTTSVTYLLDGQTRSTQTLAPYWMGGASGFSVRSLTPGAHQLQAEARVPGGATLLSNVLTLNVIASANAQFSAALTAYPNDPSAQLLTAAQLLAQTTTPGAVLSATETATRAQAIAMYRNWGIDPSLDFGNDQSTALLTLSPTHWAAGPAYAASLPLSQLFSPDAPFYQAIPAVWPRVALPAGYIQRLQLNTNQQGDGIGFGEVVAAATDPLLLVRSEWYTNLATLQIFPFPMPVEWFQQLASESAGDLHMIFVAPRLNMFVSSYKTSRDPLTGGPDALYAGSPTPLGTLGDRGGSVAARFAELPAMIQPGETTNATQKIRHALGGSVARVWAARVYPASGWDTGVRASVNTCTHAGFTNTGLVPYGGVIQLDPKLDLRPLTLSLPARRILEAIQTYGYYVMDFGCTDLDLYTAIPETELDPYGGLWGYNKKGPGVQNEVQDVLARSTLYVVAPLTKKQ